MTEQRTVGIPPALTTSTKKSGRDARAPKPLGLFPQKGRAAND